ncbi:hypothetical protein H4N58_18630 [Mumia sp. ZJ1417]|uniref:hypothetical protein n=1 Tax=Mumia sp. ZJ1417 TaxID=2708082 RepID=UPI0014242AE3|nr:hypothetical protein [Mumia sp. ZJ1417]QMW66129.1 hypothetical protein H4N58_18630 [Mumia sp. ZJ1417]
MRIDLPPERTLPDKDERAARIVATASRGRRTRALRWAAPIVASVAAATVIGVSLVLGGDDPAGTGVAAPEPEVAAAPTAAPEPAEPDVALWLRDLPHDEAATLATQCGTGMGSTRSVFEAGEVLSAQVHRALVGRGPVAVVIAEDTATGERLGCEIALRPKRAPEVLGAALMGGPGSKSTVNSNDATHPAIPTDGPGGYSLGYAGGTYQVDERVASMRQRFVVDGEPGPWHVAPAVDGYVYLQARIAASALDGVGALHLETQVLDGDGELLDAPGEQKHGGGITRNPGTTRTDDRSRDLCSLPASGASSSTCLG